MDQFFIGFRMIVFDEGVNFGEGGGEPGQVKGKSADQLFPAGLGRGLQSLRLQSAADKVVDGVARSG